MRKNEVDINEVLKEDTSLRNTMYERNFTKTSMFLLPMIGYNAANLPKSFVNAYIGDGEYPGIDGFERPIFLLFKLSLDTKHRNIPFVRFEENMINNICYVEKYYAGREDNLDLLMYVFEAPASLSYTYDKFLESKYSEFQESYKRLFPRNVPGSHGNLVMSDVYGALYKEEFLRTKAERELGIDIPDHQEYWTCIELDREIFRYKQEEDGNIQNQD